MTCFSWRRAKHGNNVFVSRSEVVSAGALGVLAILSGCLYLLDAAWIFYRKAFIDDIDDDDDVAHHQRSRRADELKDGIYYVSDQYR